MRGISLVTEVIFLAVVISLILLVYTMADPVLSSMQASSAFEQTKSFMLNLDEVIDEVSSQGKGSRRSIYLTMGAGMLTMNESLDTIRWTLETDTMMVSPRSMQRIGDLVIGANLDTRAYVNESGDAYVLENQRIKAFIKKIGSSSSPQEYNTSELLVGIYNKQMETWMPLERLEISVDGSANSTNGTGYTELAETGNALPSGEVIAHINTSYQYLDNYTISFGLESGADFLIIGASQG